MEDLGLAQAVITTVEALSSGAEFKLEAPKVLENYRKLPLAPLASRAVLETRLEKLFGKAADFETCESKYKQIYSQSVDLLFDWLAENNHVPLVESSAYKALQDLKDEESVKQGQAEAEKELEKIDQVVESIDAAAEGEQGFQDAVIPDSEQPGEGPGEEPGEEPEEPEKETVQGQYENAVVDYTEQPVAEHSDNVPQAVDVEGEPGEIEETQEVKEPTEPTEQDTIQATEKATEQAGPEQEPQSEPEPEPEPQIPESPQPKVEGTPEPTESPQEPVERLEEAPNESTNPTDSPKLEDASPQNKETSDSQSPETQSSEADVNTKSSLEQSKKESDLEESRSSAEPEDQKRKRTDDSSGNETKRRRVTKKRKPTQRALSWAKEFFSEQSVGFELDDPEVVIDYQEPSEIEERVHDEEIDSLQDLVLAVMKTYSDYSMANAAPGELEVSLTEVDKWIKQLRLFS